MSGSPTPPLPPRVPGRIHMPPARLAGTLAIIAIPILALLGVFGKSTAREAVESAVIRLDVHYPARLNYQEQEEILVRVRSRAPAPVTAVVTFDAELIEGFSDVAFIPAEETAYAIRLGTLAPGETATARVSLRGNRYGSHHGRIAVAAGGVTTAAALSMFVFP